MTTSRFKCLLPKPFSSYFQFSFALLEIIYVWCENNSIIQGTQSHIDLINCPCIKFTLFFKKTYCSVFMDLLLWRLSNQSDDEQERRPVQDGSLCWTSVLCLNNYNSQCWEWQLRTTSVFKMYKPPLRITEHIG